MDAPLAEDDAIAMALTVHGLCCDEEIRFLYRIALKAPEELPLVDLGTYQGRTAAILAATGRLVITIDNYASDPLFKSQPSVRPEEHAQQVADRLASLKLKVRVVLGDSAVIPFDDLEQIGLLFIDSKHTRERLYKELDAWLPLLVKDGILAFHDYGEPGHGPVMTPAIDERIRNKTDEWEFLGLANWLIGFRRLK